jgi:hypothetical protein
LKPMPMIAILFHLSSLYLLCLGSDLSSSTRIVADVFHTLDKDLNGFIDISELPAAFSSNVLAPQLPPDYVDSFLSVIQREKRINYESAIALLPATSIPPHNNIFLRMRGGVLLQPDLQTFSQLLAVKKSCPPARPQISSICLYQPGLTCNYFSGQCCCPFNATCTSSRTKETVVCDPKAYTWTLTSASGFLCPHCLPAPVSDCPATFLGNVTQSCIPGLSCSYTDGACCCPLGSVQQGKTCTGTITSQEMGCSAKGSWTAISGISICPPCTT